MPDSPAFRDEHLKLECIPADQTPYPRLLERIGCRSLFIGKLNRTGTASVRVSAPCVLPSAQAMHDRDLVAQTREAFLDEANHHLKATAR